MTTIADYPPFACVSELTGGREIKQEGVTVNNKVTISKYDSHDARIFPLSFGEAAYAVPVFDLK